VRAPRSSAAANTGSGVHARSCASHSHLLRREALSQQRIESAKVVEALLHGPDKPAEAHLCGRAGERAQLRRGRAEGTAKRQGRPRDAGAGLPR
jgi:hypothetical protein